MLARQAVRRGLYRRRDPYPGSAVYWDFVRSRYKGPSGVVTGDLAALGPDIVGPNGDFSTGDLTNWVEASTAPALWSVSGGVAVLSTGSATGRLRRTITGLVVGRVYQIEALTGAQLQGSATGYGLTDLFAVVGGATQVRSGVFVATSANLFLQVISTSNGTTLDNVIVREVLSGFQFSRTGAGVAEDTSGVHSTFATNTPRRTNKGLLVEEARTNNVRFSDASGAVLGVIGSGGSLPSNWSVQNNGPVAVSVVGTGVEAGLPYVDVRFAGTTNNTATQLAFEIGTAITAASGQAWALGLSARLVGGSLTNVTAFRHNITERDAGGALLSDNQSNFVLSASLARTAYFATLSNALTARVQPRISIAWASGAPVDFTVRLAAPQLEQGSFATSPIITSGAAATRGFDSGTAITGFPSAFTIFVEAEMAVANDGVVRRTATPSDGSINNRVRLSRTTSNGSQATVDSAGTAYSSNSVPGYAGARAVKHAASLDGTTLRFASDGVSVPALAAPLPIGLNRIDIGHSLAGSALNGFVRRVVIYPRAMTDAELQALTA